MVKGTMNQYFIISALKDFMIEKAERNNLCKLWLKDGKQKRKAK